MLFHERSFFANFEDIAGKLFRVSMDLSINQSVDSDKKKLARKVAKFEV